MTGKTMEILLSTRRLVLRPLQAEDAETMFRYRSRPDVSRYQSWLPAEKSRKCARSSRRCAVRLRACAARGSHWRSPCGIRKSWPGMSACIFRRSNPIRWKSGSRFRPPSSAGGLPPRRWRRSAALHFFAGQGPPVRQRRSAQQTVDPPAGTGGDAEGSVSARKHGHPGRAGRRPRVCIEKTGFPAGGRGSKLIFRVPANSPFSDFGYFDYYLFAEE